MKALMIAPEPFFTPRGTPFSVYHRSLVLSELGVEVDLLTYGEGQDVKLDGVRLIRIPRFRFLGHAKVGPSILKLFLDGFLFLWMVVLLCRERYEVVHAHEESVFFCQVLKPIFGFKLIYDMHSSLPQQLTVFQFTRSKFLIRLFEAFETRSLKRADAVITISPYLEAYAQRLMSDQSRLFLIENSIMDEVRIENQGDPVDESEKWRCRIPAGRSIIAYAGTFEKYQGLELLLQAFAQVRRSHPEVFLMMIGGSAQQVDHYRRMADELGLAGDTLFTGQTSSSTARRLLARADVLTSPRTEGINTPLKIYELLASGKPFVATRVPSHTQVLSDEVCYLAELNSRSFARALVAALTDEPRRRRVVQAAGRLYTEQYSRSTYMNKIRQVLRSLEIGDDTRAMTLG